MLKVDDDNDDELFAKIISGVFFCFRRGKESG